ncbi:hypothetical protein BKA61DRAFT_710985 [Leptodontidium sp. MPI-SDFR-AT-0119]|nr:hypothetical protein BKA61DRAFT_710985 [Leptodontidium sp. MPI-SDFR-AT-0119]
MMFLTQEEGTPSPELLSAQAELKSVLSSLAEDLADLVESVKVVQSGSYKSGLEIEEVSRRERLVDEIAKTGSGLDRRRDRDLDGVFRTVGNLKAEMLEVVIDKLTDQRMREVVRANEDGLCSCCIKVLIFVLIFLLVLVLNL